MPRSAEGVGVSRGGYNETKTLNLSTKREYIVKPEEISRMGFYEAYICDSFRKEPAHVEIT